MKNHDRKRTFSRAFTLIEMMIVIGIIGILAALTLGISSSVMRGSEIRQTENMMKILSMAFQEWELEKGRSMTYAGYAPILGGSYDTGEPPYEASVAEEASGDVLDNGAMQNVLASRMSEVIALLMDSEIASGIIRKLSGDSFDTNGNLIDPWGTPIGIVFPGPPFWQVYTSGNVDPDDHTAFDYVGDLSVLDQVEDGLGSCINVRPYFVSAGPDGRWGFRYQAAGGPDHEDADEQANWDNTLDNIYSYKPFIVEDAR